MPVITNLNATNSSFLVSAGNYVDFNIWLLLFGTAIALLVVSRFFKKDYTSSLMVGILSFLLSVAALWSSLSVARIDSAASASVVVGNTTQQYLFPAITPLNSLPLTIVCVIVTVLCALSLIDTFLVLVQGPPPPPEKPRIAINGQGLRFK
jgi:hypothetical protein